MVSFNKKTEKNIISALLITKEILGKHLKWCIFGGLAVAVHNKRCFRINNDIDIIIEDNTDTINQLFNSHGYQVDFRNRKGRERAYTIIDGIKVELLFLSGENEIVLADGKYKFRRIDNKKLNGHIFPVVDIQSIKEAKTRQKIYLENLPIVEKKKYEEIRENVILDIKFLDRIKLYENRS